ncbi:prohibitin family protein [Deinococcus malanensis]|uniref:prohibitin family protein n=1 Tax=Deinococcus malanensis TaxID=1706855 RepID=UPI00363DB551
MAIGGVVLAGLLLAQGIKVIPAGYVGVVFSALSGVKPQPLQEGVHFVVPFVDRVNLYDGRLQEITLAHGVNDGDEGAIRARSKEGLDITADVTVNFRIDRTKAAIMHKELGRNYMVTVVRPQVRSKVRDAIGQFNAADLISTQRQEVEASITRSLTEIFEKTICCSTACYCVNCGFPRVWPRLSSRSRRPSSRWQSRKPPAAGQHQCPARRSGG